MWLLVVYMRTPPSSQPALFNRMFSFTVHRHWSLRLQMARAKNNEEERQRERGERERERERENKYNISRYSVLFRHLFRVMAWKNYARNNNSFLLTISSHECHMGHITTPHNILDLWHSNSAQCTIGMCAHVCVCVCERERVRERERESGERERESLQSPIAAKISHRKNISYRMNV